MNPHLPLDEQTDLLPYNQQFEFPKNRLHLGILWRLDSVQSLFDSRNNNFFSKLER